MDARQKQRVLVVGKKIIGLEQMQSVIVHDAGTWQEHLQEMYHILSLQKLPVLDSVWLHLVEYALSTEKTEREAARVLGIAQGTLWYHKGRIRAGDYDYLKKWHQKQLPEKGEGT